MISPIFFLVVISSIEFARVHMLQAAVENACFEGARRGIVPGATSSACKTITEELIAQVGVSDFTVEVEPGTIDAATDSILVKASVPISVENGFGISVFFNGSSMVKEISLPRQRR